MSKLSSDADDEKTEIEYETHRFRRRKHPKKRSEHSKSSSRSKEPEQSSSQSDYGGPYRQTDSEDRGQQDSYYDQYGEPQYDESYDGQQDRSYGESRGQDGEPYYYSGQRYDEQSRYNEEHEKKRGKKKKKHMWSKKEDTRPQARTYGESTYRYERPQYEYEEVEEEEAESEMNFTRSATEEEGEPAIYKIEDEWSGPPSNAPTEDYSIAEFIGENEMLFVILGYILGILLVLIWYCLHPSKAGIDLNAKWLFSVLLIMVVLLICYGRGTRCVLALTMPTLSSYKGRVLLMTFAFFLAGTGPVMNIIKNIGIAARSLSCGQKRLQEAMVPMHDIIDEPIYAVEHAIYIMMSELRVVMEHMEKALQPLEASIHELSTSFQTCGAWLMRQNDDFDSQMGNPYDRCLAAGQLAVDECYKRFGPKQALCNAKKRFEWFCGNLADMKTFFSNSVELQQHLVEDVFTRLQQGLLKIRQLFEVNITFDHKTKQNDTHRLNFLRREREINAELNRQMENFLLVFLWLDVVLVLLALTVLFRSIIFRIGYLTNYNYWNFYLTDQFYHYDKKMGRYGGQNALPLLPFEQLKYIKLNSMRLLPQEIKHLTTSLFFMVLICIQLFCICMVEYSIYSLLSLMYHTSHKSFELAIGFNYTTIQINDGGMIGAILRGLVHVFEPLRKYYLVDMKSCRPRPVHPNFWNYYGIMMLCGIACLLLLWEPYGLRLRHRVMAWFYPDEAYERAKYLHRHILMGRENFFKFARRNARSLHMYEDKGEEMQSIIWLNKVYNWLWSFVELSPSFAGDICMICTKCLSKSDTIKCTTLKCPGIFCRSCYVQSKRQCCICSTPSLYGDYSDLSEIEDSSDDPEAIPYRPDQIVCRYISDSSVTLHRLEESQRGS